MKNINSAKRIIIRMPNWLGDCVMAAPVIESIRALLPNAKIDVAIKDNMAGLGAILPAVDNVIALPEKGGSQRGGAIKSALKAGYDLLILLPNSFRSAWEFYDRSIPVRIGYAGGFRSFLLTNPVAPPVRRSLHQVEYYRKIVSSLFPDLPNVAPIIEIPKSATQIIESLLPRSDKPLVGIGFGATYGTAKMWPVERFAQTIDRISASADVVLLGAESERGIEREIMEKTTSNPTSLVGKTDIIELAAALKKMSLFITNDSGPMHLASVVGADTVALFGPTSPDETRPWVGGEIIYHNADCSPCWKRNCDTDHRCMESISVDEVVHLAMKKLTRA